MFTTQSCADCNFFMCHCKNSCDCKNSCATNCSQDQTACIADCTQSNCSYCDAYYHACMGRCGSSAATSSTIAEPEPDASAPTAACQQVYKAVDADRNGAVSKKEFVDFIVAQRKVAWPANGVLTPVQGCRRLGSGPGSCGRIRPLGHEPRRNHRSRGGWAALTTRT
jgi:hypothetical protein